MEKTTRLSLYYFRSCPYCVRVLIAMKRLGLEGKIELRNKRKHPEYAEELVEATGIAMVPCLRIEDDTGRDEWIHESLDIIDWLETHQRELV